MENQEQCSMESILEKLEIGDLHRFLAYLQSQPELLKLQRCTQMLDDAIRNNQDNITNRFDHSHDVSFVAEKICELIVARDGEKTEDEEKQILIAKIIGLAHDLGHTPMGHATEDVLTDKIGSEFGHDKYGGVVFAQLFDRYCSTVNAQSAQRFMESGLREYIIEGIQQHGQYMVDDDKFKKTRAANDLPLICGRLADTLSFMVADLMDLSKTTRADGIEGTILSEEIISRIVKEGVSTEIGAKNTEGIIKNSGQLPTESIILEGGETLANCFESTEFKAKHPDFNYTEIINMILEGGTDNKSTLQGKIAEEVANANIDEKGNIRNPMVAISDRLKYLRKKQSKRYTNGRRKTRA